MDGVKVERGRNCWAEVKWFLKCRKWLTVKRPASSAALGWKKQIISGLLWSILTVAAKAGYRGLYTLLQWYVKVCTFTCIIRDSKVRLSSLPLQRLLSSETQPQTSSSLFRAVGFVILPDCGPVSSPWLETSLLDSSQFLTLCFSPCLEKADLFLLSSNSGQGGSALGQALGPWNHQLRMLGLVGEHVPQQGLEPWDSARSVLVGAEHLRHEPSLISFCSLPCVPQFHYSAHAVGVTSALVCHWRHLLPPLPFDVLIQMAGPHWEVALSSIWQRWLRPARPCLVLLVSNPARVKV